MLLAIEFKFIALIATILVLCRLGTNWSNGAEAVVVDGHKRNDISALKHQKKEEEALGSFNTKTCGISDTNREEHEFINMAREGQFPWMASFQLRLPVNFTYLGNGKIRAPKNVTTIRDPQSGQVKLKERDLHFCCGSFISERWILTAAHCFDTENMNDYLNDNKLKTVTGSHKVSSKDPLNVNLKIDKIFIHKLFNKKMPVGFDIALVELHEPVEFKQARVKNGDNEQVGPFMNAICLPKRDKRYKFNETGRLAGWGLSHEMDETSMPSKLLTTDILLSDTDKCLGQYVKHLKSNKPLEQKEKHDDIICAGFKDARDACQSDSGAPLVQYADDKGVLIGIVSYGIGCASKGVPGLYTRTSAYISWIKEITKYGKKSSVPFKLLERTRRAEAAPSPLEAPSERPLELATITSKPAEANSFVISSTEGPREESKAHSDEAGKFKFLDDK